MEVKQKKAFDSESVIKGWYKAIPRQVKVAFIIAFITGLLVHLYMFVNKYPNHDDLTGMFVNYDQAWAGRWLIKYLMPINTSISLPWVNGVFSILMVAIMSAIIVSMFDVKRPVMVALVAGVMACSPILATVFAYMFLADVNMFAALLAVLGAYIAEKKRFGFVFSAVLFACSMAVYQTLIFFAASLMAIQFILYILNKRKTERDVISLMWRYAASLILGALIYAIVTKIFLIVNNTSLSYLNTSEILAPNIAEIPHRIFQCYYYFVQYSDWYSPFCNTRWIQYVYMLVVFSFYLLVVLLMLLGGKRRVWRFILAGIVALAMPILLNGTYLAAGFAHSLMIYSMTVLFIGVIVLFNHFSLLVNSNSAQGYRFLNFIGSWFVVLSMVAFCYSWSLYSNQAYFAMQRKYEASYSLSTRMVDRIEQVPEFTKDTPVLFVGSFYLGNYSCSVPEAYYGMAYTVGTEDNTEYSYLSGSYGWLQAFLRAFLGVDYADVDPEKLNDLVRDYNDFADMPSYPAAGSVQYLDGVIVVKTGP